MRRHPAPASLWIILRLLRPPAPGSRSLFSSAARAQCVASEEDGTPTPTRKDHFEGLYFEGSIPRHRLTFDDHLTRGASLRLRLAEADWIPGPMRKRMLERRAWHGEVVFRCFKHANVKDNRDACVDQLRNLLCNCSEELIREHRNRVGTTATTITTNGTSKPMVAKSRSGAVIQRSVSKKSVPLDDIREEGGRQRVYHLDMFNHGKTLRIVERDPTGPTGRGLSRVAAHQQHSIHIPHSLCTQFIQSLAAWRQMEPPSQQVERHLAVLDDIAASKVNDRRMADWADRVLAPRVAQLVKRNMPNVGVLNRQARHELHPHRLRSLHMQLQQLQQLLDNIQPEAELLRDREARILLRGLDRLQRVLQGNTTAERGEQPQQKLAVPEQQHVQAVQQQQQKWQSPRMLSDYKIELPELGSVTDPEQQDASVTPRALVNKLLRRLQPVLVSPAQLLHLCRRVAGRLQLQRVLTGTWVLYERPVDCAKMPRQTLGQVDLVSWLDSDDPDPDHSAPASDHRNLRLQIGPSGAALSIGQLLTPFQPSAATSHPWLLDPEISSGECLPSADALAQKARELREALTAPMPNADRSETDG